MKAIEIHLNGRHLLTAGVGDDGLVCAGFVWSGWKSIQIPPPYDQRIHLNVGGVDGATDEHVEWSIPAIGVGDEVRLRVIETEIVSPEHRRYRFDPSEGDAEPPSPPGPISSESAEHRRSLFDPSKGDAEPISPPEPIPSESATGPAARLVPLEFDFLRSPP